MNEIAKTFATLKSSAPFWSLRYTEEKSEFLAVRDDVAEPPRLASDRGAMLTAMANGGCGYAATSDLSPAGLQAALDRATSWANASTKISAVPYDPAKMPAPRGNWTSPPSATSFGSIGERFDLLAAECHAAKVDSRIVDRYASLDIIHGEQLYLSNHGAEVHQQFRYTIPHAYVCANRDSETQTRSLGFAQQGGMDILQRAGFRGCGRRLAEDALQLLLAANCPSGKMDLLLLPEQMMLQIHESIGQP